MTSVKFFVGGVLLLTLTACAGTYHSYVDTLKLAFTTTADVELSLEDVKKAPSDLVYVKHGERPVAAMALYKIEAGQHKWISADKAMLVEEKGRVVRTVGFADNLLFLTNTASDPLRDIKSIRPDTSWLRLADWQHGEYGYQLRSSFEIDRSEQLVFFQRTVPVTLVVEHVQYEDKPNYLRFDSDWQNRFWFDSGSGTLIKSEQRLAPFGQLLTMTYISRIARVLPADTSRVGGEQ